MIFRKPFRLLVAAILLPGFLVSGLGTALNLRGLKSSGRSVAAPPSDVRKRYALPSSAPRFGLRPKNRGVAARFLNAFPGRPKAFCTSGGIAPALDLFRQSPSNSVRGYAALPSQSDDVCL